ncbi:hypothetical protein F0U61_34065 [Archangium violaceum]|uniref:hypothetical protein n=1 Tax=Archangium violaceum TaxID=83451 RepID=UPI002B2F734F|nr:hypothetical protein F0U61_34065 [Archangium violaceum]
MKTAPTATGRYVLHVGQPTSVGAFDAANWNVFAEWAAAHVDEVLLFYSPRGAVESVISQSGLRGSEESFPDSDAQLRGMRFSSRDNDLGVLLRRVPFDPERGVTHMMCSREGQLVASLEVEDGTNFVVLDLPEAVATALAQQLDSPVENVRLCEESRGYISRIVAEGAPWLPLGQRLIG